jgi:hypothetical protein
MGAFAETKDLQPQGWPTLIFENSIVGSGSMKLGSERPPRPSLRRLRAIEGASRGLEPAKKGLRNRLSALVRNF